MILKSSRINTTSGAGPVAAHVLRGAANESIALVHGSETELHNAVADARDAGKKFALRHWKLSPGEPMSRADALHVVDDLAAEFGFESADATVVEHEKPRHGGAGFDHHWHVIVPELRRDGRVLDSAWDRARHEKIARLAELRLGHAPTSGAFNVAVARALHADGLVAESRLVARLVDVNNPRLAEAYSTATHQAAARAGLSMPDLKAAVVSAWERSDSGDSLKAAALESGIRIEAGKKAGTWIAMHGDTFLGSLDRLTRQKKRAVTERMEKADVQPEPTPPPLIQFTSAAGKPGAAHGEGRDRRSQQQHAAPETPRPARAAGGRCDEPDRRHPVAPAATGEVATRRRRTPTENRVGAAQLAAQLARRPDELSEIRNLTAAIKRRADPYQAARAELDALYRRIGREPHRDPVRRNATALAKGRQAWLVNGIDGAIAELDGCHARYRQARKARSWWNLVASKEERAALREMNDWQHKLGARRKRAADWTAVQRWAAETAAKRERERNAWLADPSRIMAMERHRLLSAALLKSAAPDARAAWRAGDIDQAIGRQATHERQVAEEAKRQAELEAKRQAEVAAEARRQARREVLAAVGESLSWRPSFRF